MSGLAFLDYFSVLNDPRQAWKILYPLPEILLLVLCGTLAGAETFVEIERWGKGKLELLRRLRPFARGIPAHDTLNDVLNALPARVFAECFTAWADSWREAAPDLVASDGKTSRRARPLRSISSRLGPAAGGWSWDRRRWRSSRTRSRPFPCCWNG
jgi:hypothetical protein